MAENRSSVFFESNLAPVGESFIDDVRFLSRIHDPVALTKLKNDHAFFQYRFTPLQQIIYDKCGIPCTYGDRDDYPWGIPIGNEENTRAVCRCQKRDCLLFGSCHFDLDLEAAFGARESGRKVVDPVEELNLERLHEENTTHLDPLTENYGPDHDDETLETMIRKAREARQEEPVSPQEASIREKDDLGAEIRMRDEVPVAPARDETLPPDGGDVCKRAEEKEEAFSEEFPDQNYSVAVPPFAEMTGCRSFEDFVPVGQDEIASLPADAKVLVNAPPGAGKTHVLIERIKYLVNQEEIAPQNILVLTFTKVAAAVITERIGNCAGGGKEFANLAVGTFDSFASTLLNMYRDTHPALCPPIRGNHHEEQIAAAATLISTLGVETLELCCHVIIDEVQDLSGQRAKLIMAMLSALPAGCGATLLGDSCQSIFDWQGKDDSNAILSTDLYNWLMSAKSGISRYASFSRDYRKSAGNCLPDTRDYRRSILSGINSEADSSLSSLLDIIPRHMPPLESKTVTQLIQAFPEDETMSIITRTNGMALTISSMLSVHWIPHVMLRRREGEDMAGWIADMLMDFPSQTIHKDEFVQKYMSRYGETEELALARWLALVGEEAAPRREIRDLLAGLEHNKSPLLWSQPGIPDCRIEVGNVFRTKGREYDNVILVDELFQDKNKTASRDDEHRVRYVALTRARKQLTMLSVSENTGYISKDDVSHRHYRSGLAKGVGFRPRYIARFETGLPGDLDAFSFAQSPCVQQSLATKALPGVQLKLCKNRREGDFPIYDICLENEYPENVVLGHTTQSYGESLERSLKNIYKKPMQIIKYANYPDELTDIYVSAATSHAAVWDSSLAGAAKFGDMAIWRGISCHGFAFTRKESY